MTNQKNKTDFGGSVNNICSKTLLKEKNSPLVCVEKTMAACSKEIKGKKHVVKCKKSTGACKQ